MSPQDFMHGASPAAREVAQFGWWVLICFCIASALVWILLLRILVRRSGGNFAAHEPAEEERGKPWIWIGGLVIPMVVFVALFFLMFGPMEASPAHQHGGGEHADIRVVGRQWWFEAEYRGDGPDQTVRVPTELHIPVGQPVDIELEARDVIHSFWVPKLHGKVDLVPGRVNHVRISADQPGRYRGECAEFCGVQHAHMRIEIVADEPADYRRWLDAQRSSAAENPGDAQATRGREVFMSAACALCHTVRGTDARGQVGPDLTHVASRARIAGGAFPNDTANLAAWVTDAQSLKPGSQMPSLRQLSGPDLRALVAYLQSLH